MTGADLLGAGEVPTSVLISGGWVLVEAAVVAGGVGDDGLVDTNAKFLVLQEGVLSRDLLCCSSSSRAGDTALYGTTSRPEINAFHSLEDKRS
jgi:hypothetical protein